MVFETWVQCISRFPSLKQRYPRTYHCKDRAARVAHTPADAALHAFRAFVLDAKNDKFELQLVYVRDPETGVQGSYQVVLRDGGPYLRRTLRYGEDASCPRDEVHVPDLLTDSIVYDEALQLAQKWQTREDRLDAARLAAYAIAQTQEDKQCE
jgi:hypothetical protein